MKKYIIEFTDDEIEVVNGIFKVAQKNLHKQLLKKQNLKNDRKIDLFFSVINKFYNAKKGV